MELKKLSLMRKNLPQSTVRIKLPRLRRLGLPTLTATLKPQERLPTVLRAAQPRMKTTSSSVMPALLLPKSSSLRTAAEIQLSVLPKQTAKNTRHTSCVTVSTQASDLRSCLTKCRPSVFRRTRTDIQKKSTSANKKLRIVAQLRRSFLLQYPCFVI